MNNATPTGVGNSPSGSSSPGSFPWHKVPKEVRCGQNDKEVVVARNIYAGNGDIRVGIADNLTMNNGRIRKAIVFKSIKGGNGNVDQLFCLSDTEIVESNGDIPQPILLSMEKLVAMALDEAKLE
jgi:hypothetical protein